MQYKGKCINLGNASYFAAIWNGKISQQQIDKILEVCISFELVDKEVEGGVPFQVGIIFANLEAKTLFRICEVEGIKIYTAEEFGKMVVS